MSQANELPGNYTLSEGSDHLCFIAQFDLTLNVEYTMSDEVGEATYLPHSSISLVPFAEEERLEDSIEQRDIPVLPWKLLVEQQSHADDRHVR